MDADRCGKDLFLLLAERRGLVSRQTSGGADWRPAGVGCRDVKPAENIHMRDLDDPELQASSRSGEGSRSSRHPPMRIMGLFFIWGRLNTPGHKRTFHSC